MRRTKELRQRKNLVRLIGYDSTGNVVFAQSLSPREFHDEAHAWDSDAGVLSLGLARLVGEIVDLNGGIREAFEVQYSASTGEVMNKRSRFADGFVMENGVLHKPESKGDPDLPNDAPRLHSRIR